MKKLSLLLLTALLSACQTTTPISSANLVGEVFYLQRMALPPEATLSVKLQDVSRADAPAMVLAEQRGPIKNQVPLPFQLSYDPAQVIPGHRYSVSARIELDGQLLFVSTENNPVQLDGSDPKPLRIRLNPAR